MLKAKYDFEFGGIKFKNVKEGDEPGISQLINSISPQVFSAIVPAPVALKSDQQQQSATTKANATNNAAPTLKAVIDDFLDGYPQNKKPAMFKKHQAVLSMFLDVVGDKPVTELKQAHVNEFFKLLGRLPPRWSSQCKKRNLTVRELAELEFDITLGPKSLEDTYIASVRPFLIGAKKNWGDQGFPLGLTTDGTEYQGDREEDENKQRAFERKELSRLFEGDEMREFASDESTHHFYWLPHIGLFTGARVNEICQLNPQTDILQDDESGAWYFWITKETEADDRIRKSVKTGDSRKVPVHKKLIELGFIDYVQRMKKAGHKLIFPLWPPINRRASGSAEKWFRQFLRDTKLRDETPKANILGMHAFRFTLATYGAKQKPPLSLFCITGHAQDEAPIHATGAGKGYLTLSLLSPLDDRAELLNQLDYGIQFHQPAKL
jgi:integrase